MRYDVLIKVSIPGIATRDTVVTLDAPDLVTAIAQATLQVVAVVPAGAQLSQPQIKPIGIA